MSACPLVILACESLHVCTVCIWRCEQARFCVEVFLCAIYKFSFIHSFILVSGCCFFVFFQSAGNSALEDLCIILKKLLLKELISAVVWFLGAFVVFSFYALYINPLPIYYEFVCIWHRI